MNRYSDLIYAPWSWFFLGGFCLIVAGISASIGQAPIRGWVYHTKTKAFWFVVAAWFFGGIYFIGYFLYKISD